jgi:hypothetical protein
LKVSAKIRIEGISATFVNAALTKGKSKTAMPESATFKPFKGIKPLKCSKRVKTYTIKFLHFNYHCNDERT